MPSNYYIKKYVETYIFDQTLTGRHMVFLAGPRQVGKTRLAKHWLNLHGCRNLYFNWDDIAVRQSYLANSRFFESPARMLNHKDPCIVFDEIHKRNKWRDILKGAYDIFCDEFRFLVTGSARLDLFRRSGDSLVGRYNLFHMMPLNIGEIIGKPFEKCFLRIMDPILSADAFKNQAELPVSSDIKDAYNALMQYGPFPEPFLRQNERFCRKWHQDYFSLLIREDLRDVSRIIELDKIENLILLLSPRIMAPLSMANLAGELEVAHTTIKSWLEQLKRLFLVFPVSPWVKKIPRGLRKGKKWYFIDWYYAPEGSARLENMVATYMYRTCKVMTDMGYGDYRLHYVRTLDKKEIDFVIARDNKPILAVEVKKGDMALTRPLKDRKKWFPDSNPIGIQVVDKRDVLQKHPGNTWIMSVERFLSLLI